MTRFFCAAAYARKFTAGHVRRFQSMEKFTVSPSKTSNQFCMSVVYVLIAMCGVEELGVRFKRDMSVSKFLLST